MTKREELITQIQNYHPCNEQEEKDKALILEMLKVDNIFTRDNRLAHMTVSGWIVNENMDKALMAFHNIYNSWSWLGGHADGEEDLLEVAIREAREESGIKSVRPWNGEILSLEVLTVDGHEKRGEYVSCHLHLNVTYLLIADEGEKLIVKEDENSNVAWFGLDEAIEKSTEPWFKERIYPKLNNKVKGILQ